MINNISITGYIIFILYDTLVVIFKLILLILLYMVRDDYPNSDQ